MTLDLDHLLRLCEVAHQSSPASEAFHDATNPATVRELVERVMKAEEERDEYREKWRYECSRGCPHWGHHTSDGVERVCWHGVPDHFDRWVREKTAIVERAEKAESAAAAALATADGYREYSDRVEVERDALKVGLATAKETLRLYLDDCAQCGCSLHRPDQPPHCYDCVVDEDRNETWETKRLALATKGRG